MLGKILKITWTEMFQFLVSFFQDKPLIAWGIVIFIIVISIISSFADGGPGCFIGALVFFIGFPLIIWIIVSIVVWIRVPKQALPNSNTSPYIYITETGNSIETIGVEKIPMPNCDNPNSYEYIADVSQQVENKVVIDGNIGTELLPVVELQLQARYGIEEANIRTETRSIKLYASPNTSVDYFMTWRYVWYEGFITIERGNEQEIHPYKINKVDFVPENPVTQNCEP